MRRLSAPLVVAVALAAAAVIAELATPDPWVEQFLPLRLLSIALMIAACIAGILGTSQLRSPGRTLPIAIATLGFATMGVSAVATMRYGMPIRDLMFNTDSRHTIDDDVLVRGLHPSRWWSLVGSFGIVGSIAGLGLVSRRIVPAGAAVVVAVIAIVLTSHVSPADFTMGDAVTAPIWQHAAWVVGLAVIVSLAGAPAPALASEGFRGAGIGLWIRALVLAIALGVALGGTPKDGDAHAFLHAITVAMFVAMLVAFVVAAWGLVNASRLDQPAVARWLLAGGAGILLVAAGAWIVVLPGVYDEEVITVDHFDDALVIVQGLAFVSMMIGLASVVRRHGLHEIRSGAGFRIGAVIVLLAIVLALRVPDVATPSPSLILRGILMIVVSVIAARDCTNVAHRLTRVPDMPTATLL